MPLAVYILGLAVFSIGTAELMVAGMTATLSDAFGISVGDVGHLISYYAFGVMLGGPVLTYFFLKYKVQYRKILLILLALYVVIQGLSAFVSSLYSFGHYSPYHGRIMCRLLEPLTRH